MGRPTKLTPELIESAKQYLRTCVDVPLADGKTDVNLPTIEGLAIHLEIHKDTVFDWCKHKRDMPRSDPPDLFDLFSDCVKDVLQEQGKKLVKGGLGGQYNNRIAAMMLSGHGYFEKKQTDHTSGGLPIQGTPGGDIQKLRDEFNEKARQSIVDGIKAKAIEAPKQ